MESWKSDVMDIPCNLECSKIINSDDRGIWTQILGTIPTNRNLGVMILVTLVDGPLRLKRRL